MSFTIKQLNKACEKSGLNNDIFKAIVNNLPKKRSPAQNRALHVLFSIISDQLNEIGDTFKIDILGHEFESRYTPEIIKEYMWKPIQETMFGIKSTKDLNTKMINEIVDSINLLFSKWGVDVGFPHYDRLEGIAKVYNGSNMK